MSLRGLRIGYVPYSRDLTEPGDRRRFVHWARARGVAFDLARPGDDHDVVVLSSRADVGRWSTVPRGRTKLVYELIDSYLAVGDLDPRNLLRGTAKWLARETSRPHLSYRRAVLAMARRADAMVCSTEEQRAQYLGLCPNVHLILDVQTEIETSTKDRYSIDRESLRLVWEGLPFTLDDLAVIRDVLADLHRDHPLTLHLVTAPTYKPWAGRLGHRDTMALARKVTSVPLQMHHWSPATLAEVATSSDLAIIPLDLTDPFARGKPENKLLGFWRLGLPVVASATPAYRRVMDAAGLDLVCADPADWDRALRRLVDDEDARAHAGQRGLQFVHEHRSEEATLAAWDALFDSL